MVESERPRSDRVGAGSRGGGVEGRGGGTGEGVRGGGFVRGVGDDAPGVVLVVGLGAAAIWLPLRLTKLLKKPDRRLLRTYNQASE
jgi:hypothetical protein